MEYRRRYCSTSESCGYFSVTSIQSYDRTLLQSLFIPQSCGDEICSIQQNYENNDVYHKSVLYWNMFSMVTFYTYYLIELRREEWAIKFLDIDNDKPDNTIKRNNKKRTRT